MGFRTDLANALVTALNTYQTANPTLLRDVRKTRPAAFGETPCAYVGPRNESLVHSSGTRARAFTVPVVVADVLADNEETSDRFDILVDSLIDYFTANPHAVSGTTLVEPVAVEDLELDYGTVIYRAVSITLRGQVLEGRS